jgi:acyl-CoA oxidase
LIKSFICSLFNTEKTTLASAAKRIKKLIDSGLDPYDAFNIVQHQMIDVAQAYLERVVLEQFQETTQNIKDKNSKEVMLKLYQLYALQIEKNKGWYLEDGYMEAVKTKYARWLISCVGKLGQMFL